MNTQPLLTDAEERAAYRLALIRSLSCDGTGLSQRRHNRLVELLERLASESFSNGVITQARTKVIAKALNRDRSTILRILADARTLGIVVSKDQFGVIGQQISSERTIIWERVAELVTRSREARRAADGPADCSPAPTATGAPQLRRGRRNCDGGAAIAAPYRTDNPDRSDSHTKSGGSDRSFDPGRTVSESVIRDAADRLFRRLAYSGDQGYSLWLAAAAVRLGLLDEASVATAAALAGEAGKGPGWFRVVLADKAGMDGEALTALLKSIRVTPRLPGCRPVMNRGRPPDSQPVFQRPPAASVRNIDAEINDRRNELLRFRSS